MTQWHHKTVFIVYKIRQISGCSVLTRSLKLGRETSLRYGGTVRMRPMSHMKAFFVWVGSGHAPRHAVSQSRRDRQLVDEQWARADAVICYVRLPFSIRKVGFFLLSSYRYIRSILGTVLLRKWLKSVELVLSWMILTNNIDWQLQFTEGTRVQFNIHLPRAATKFVRFLAS